MYRLKQALKKALKKLREWRLPHNSGYCVICERPTVFIVYNDWLRDNYLCRCCGTIPRNRALVNALNVFCPDWKKLGMHESSPGGELSVYLKSQCKDYTSSHYYSDVPRGEYKGTHRSEDLSAMTFADMTFDLFVTSDVFEHVLNAEKAFFEIARVLKPGGMHIFSMPWYPEKATSVRRAVLRDSGEIEHLLEAVYHGNPIDKSGSLVTYDWGLDFCDVIYRNSGMTTCIYTVRDRKLGIDGRYLEIFVSRKSKHP
jgi:SAM-dependent methyltransferase